jgi:hypothetical protein
MNKRHIFHIRFSQVVLGMKSKEWQVPGLHLTGIVYAKI